MTARTEAALAASDDARPDLLAAGAGSGGPAAAQIEREVSFITGVNGNGALTSNNFWTWDTKSKNPAIYDPSKGSAHKWAGGAAGSAGGVVTYYFDPSANWSRDEKEAFRSSFALWSAEADISFRQVSSPRAADVVLERNSDNDAFEDDTYKVAKPGSTILPATNSDAVITIDTPGASYGDITSFSAHSGYGIGLLVHEIGHLIGLGHGGPYNGDVKSAVQQLGPLDNRLWTIMSYISPNDQNAKYYNQNPVSGTGWGDRSQSFTPQMLDILAAQRLYGAAQSGPLTTGQVFGFNTSITGDIRKYFDFTIDKRPVITIWDSGTGNTLDLSGYTRSSTVNLNAGTFSSANGMTNNIAIATGTSIDTAIGGAGNDSFTVNADSDTIDGRGGHDSVHFSLASTQYRITYVQDGVQVTNKITGAVDMLTDVHSAVFTDKTLILDAEPDQFSAVAVAGVAASAQAASVVSATSTTSPTQAQINAEVSFLSGVSTQGATTARNYWTWNGQNPAHYSADEGSAHKWSGGAAGTAGIVTYYFDPAAGWSADEMKAWKGAFALWSAEANITFKEVRAAANAEVTIQRSASGASAFVSYTPAAVGSTELATSEKGQIELSTKDYGSITSFDNGALGITTMVHEIGHLLGLGHAGPYNSDVDPATQQLGPLDMMLWSNMSYIAPSNQDAKFASQYPVQDTSWHTTDEPLTPQMLDIQAAQRLYGTPADTPLSGNDVFGFHTNITGAVRSYFDFTVDKNPILTLWDAGTNNTLDVSGFSQAATINLNAGTFSSVDGMTNNIGIAYGTSIDKAVGGAGDDTFFVNAANDMIDGRGGENTVTFAKAQDAYRIAFGTNDVTVADKNTGIVDTLTNVQRLGFTSGVVIVDQNQATQLSADTLGIAAPSFLAASDSTDSAFATPDWSSVDVGQDASAATPSSGYGAVTPDVGVIGGADIGHIVQTLAAVFATQHPQS